MRKIGIFKGYPCYAITLREYEIAHEDSVVYVICDPGDDFDVDKPRNYAMVLDGVKIAVWDGKYVRECQPEEWIGLDKKNEQASADTDRGHENGSFSEYSAVVDEFFKNLEV